MIECGVSEAGDIWWFDISTDSTKNTVFRLSTTTGGLWFHKLKRPNSSTSYTTTLIWSHS